MMLKNILALLFLLSCSATQNIPSPSTSSSASAFASVDVMASTQPDAILGSPQEPMMSPMPQVVESKPTTPPPSAVACSASTQATLEVDRYILTTQIDCDKEVELVGYRYKTQMEEGYLFLIGNGDSSYKGSECTEFLPKEGVQVYSEIKFKDNSILQSPPIILPEDTKRVKCRDQKNSS